VDYFYQGCTKKASYKANEKPFQISLFDLRSFCIFEHLYEKSSKGENLNNINIKKKPQFNFLTNTFFSIS